MRPSKEYLAALKEAAEKATKARLDELIGELADGALGLHRGPPRNHKPLLDRLKDK